MSNFLFAMATLGLVGLLDAPVRRATKHGQTCMLILGLAAAWFGIYLCIIKPALK